MHPIYMRTILEAMISKNNKFTGQPEEKQASKVNSLAKNLLSKLKPSTNYWAVSIPIFLFIGAGIVYSSCIHGGCQVSWCNALMNCD